MMDWISVMIVRPAFQRHMSSSLIGGRDEECRCRVVDTVGFYFGYYFVHMVLMNLKQKNAKKVLPSTFGFL